MDSHIWTEVGCDADAIIKLINQGMDLGQRSSFFKETVLHYWAGGHCFSKLAMDDGFSHQEDSLRVVKLLIEKGADPLASNNWGFTPLLEAAKGPYRGELPNLKVLDFLLETNEYSRSQNIEAMELAGTVILQNVKNVSLFPKAFDYWRKALRLRQMDVKETGCIEDLRYNKKNLQITEWANSVELEDVIENPDKFTIKAFFVRLRIFSSKLWRAINFLFESAIHEDCFKQPLYQDRFVETFDNLWAILETLLSRSDLEGNKDAHWKIGRVVKRLIEVFTFFEKDSPDFWTEEIIKTSLDVMLSATSFDSLVLYYLIGFLRILPHLPQWLLNKIPIEILSNVRDRRGRNLLHEAFGFGKFDSNIYATIRLLLCAGCDPNAIDEVGNVPLHFLAQIDERYFSGDLDSIAVLLLDFGAQLSRKNADGKTAVQLLIRKIEKSRNKDANQGIIVLKLPNWCSELPTLKCLSARVIRRNRIPHLELPATLILMIEKHKIP